MSTPSLQKMIRDRFRVMSLAPRRKCQRNVVQMKKAMAAVFGSDSVAISCHCKRSKIILVKVLTGVLLTCRKDMPKRCVIFTLFVYCMFRATRYKKKL